MTEATSYQRLREHLAYLGMTAASEHLASALDRGLKEKLSPTQVLEQLLEIEVAQDVIGMFDGAGILIQPREAEIGHHPDGPQTGQRHRKAPLHLALYR